MPILKLEFIFNCLDNPMKLIVDNTTISPDENGKATYIANITFPCKIIMHVNGKTKYDTIQDNQGNIIKDKCIILNHVDVDGIKPDTNFLKKWPRISVNGAGSNQIVYSNYFGFNGIVELEFEGKNLFQWLLRTNRFRDNSWHQL